MILSCLSPLPIIFLKDKAYIGGKGFANAYGKIVDYLYKNNFTNNSCIIEIKTPNKILITDHKYRDNIYNMSNELMGGINQIIAYKESLTKEYNNLKANDNSNYECWNIKTILIIGKISSIKNDQNKLRQFEFLRNSIHNVDIITFDELLKKLENILKQISSK